MLTLILVFLLLKLPLTLCILTENICHWRIKQNGAEDRDMQKDCTFLLYVKQKHLGESDLFEVPVVHLPPDKYEFGLVLDYAIDEINKNPKLLPNMSLGFYLWTELCNLVHLRRAIRSINKSVLGIIANYVCSKFRCHVPISGKMWKTSAILAPFMQIYSIPQVTYGPFHPFLSNPDEFPYLYQVAPKDTQVPLTMVSLMVHFSWNWVGLVISDDDQGIQFLSDLREEMQRNGVCSAFVSVVPVVKQLYMSRTDIYSNQIVTSSANVVIIYGDMTTTLEVHLRRWEKFGASKIWITTTQWDVITTESASILDKFHRTFTFSHHRGDIYGLKNFIQTLKSSKYLEDISWANLDWKYFNCSFLESRWKMSNNFSSNISLETLTWLTFDVAMRDESYNIYNAVYAVAHSLHELLLQQVDIQSMENAHGLESDCGKLHHILKNIQFTNPVGDLVSMKEKGKLNSEYDIFNLWDFPKGLQLKVKIGQFSPCLPKGHQLQLSEDMIEWTTGTRQIPRSVCSVTCMPGFRKSHQEGKAACCFDCSHCPKNEISNETDMEQCVMCPDDQYANAEQTHCLQRAVIFLAYEEPMGMALAFTALCFSALTTVVLWVFVKHHDTPIVKANNRTLSYILLISLTFCFLCSLLFIGHPNTAKCILQQTIFGMVFTVAISTVLAKTVIVVLAFKLTAPGKMVRWLLVSGAPNFIIPTCTLIQLILYGVWLGQTPPFIETDTLSEHGHIVIVCNKGSVTAFYFVLGYLGFLALGSFTVAFLARNLPDTFNEAKFLTFSMLVFCSVWATFLPVFHSTKGKVMVAVEVFSILTSSAGLLVCIFVPKCYIIFLRPDKNSLPRYRDKTHKIIS